MPRKLRSPKRRIDDLTVQQKWELVTGVSIHPDHFIMSEAEMREAWRDHADTIRAWRDENEPNGEIWIEACGT